MVALIIEIIFAWMLIMFRIYTIYDYLLFNNDSEYMPNNSWATKNTTHIIAHPGARM